MARDGQWQPPAGNIKNFFRFTFSMLYGKHKRALTLHVSAQQFVQVEGNTHTHTHTHTHTRTLPSFIWLIFPTLNCLIVLFYGNLSDPKGKFSFHTISNNNKVVFFCMKQPEGSSPWRNSVKAQTTVTYLQVAQFLQLVVAVDRAALAVHILRQFADLLLRLRQLRSQTFHRRRLFGRQVLRGDRRRKTSTSG